MHIECHIDRGRLCEVGSHAVLRSRPMIVPFCNKSRIAARYPGSKFKEHDYYWPWTLASVCRWWPHRCNAIHRQSGGFVAATKKQGWKASWRMRRAPATRPTFPPLARAQIVQLACLEPVAKGLHITHWSSEDLARQAMADGIAPCLSARTVRRILHDADLQPHRTRYWKTSHLDACFKQRAEQILWCYANANRLRENGFLVVCADEMPNLQALERNPIRRAIPGNIEQLEFEYIRHGTVNVLLFLIVSSGRIQAFCPEHKDADHYIEALEQFRSHHRRLRGAFLIQDGDPSHTAAATAEYFQLHPWWRPRFTPVHASWLNQGELLNHAFSHRYLKRASWNSRTALIEHIDAAWPEYNRLYAHPFQWCWTNHRMRTWFDQHRDIVPHHV